MLRQRNDLLPDWLVELANAVRYLIWNYQARAQFQRRIQAWRAENGEGAGGLYGRLPDRELTRDEQYVVLAAIHDQCCKGVKKLNPWPDPADDPATRAAMKRRDDYTYSERQTDFAGTLFYIACAGIQTSLPESDVANVEHIIRQVEEDLKADCDERGKEVRTSSFDEHRPAPRTAIEKMQIVHAPQTNNYVTNDNRIHNETNITIAALNPTADDKTESQGKTASTQARTEAAKCSGQSTKSKGVPAPSGEVKLRTIDLKFWAIGQYEKGWMLFQFSKKARTQENPKGKWIERGDVEIPGGKCHDLAKAFAFGGGSLGTTDARKAVGRGDLKSAKCRLCKVITNAIERANSNSGPQPNVLIPIEYDSSSRSYRCAIDIGHSERDDEDRLVFQSEEERQKTLGG
jgi:hypothetical protein